ncbi:hypothetical protein BDN67DRAFT_984040 [Paxillus ammoniavirescens]|nr:hypothetical protein BDN67DRAFT_984040 [Paxillus ammoniavirescens]
MHLAQSMGDIHGILIEHAIEGAPRLLQDQLTEGYSSWEDFIEGVRAIRKEMLDIEQQRLEENKARNNTVANLQQQMIQMSLQTQCQPPLATNLGAPTQQYGIPAPPPGQNTQMGLRLPNTTTTMGRGTLFPQTPLSRAQILERVNTIPQRPNTDIGKRAYKADINLWHQTHGNAPPSLERPYLIKPGTAQAGSWECFGCGAIMDPPHMGYTCNATEPLCPQETCWRQLVVSMLR